MSERYKVGQVLIHKDDHPSNIYRVVSVGEKIEVDCLGTNGWFSYAQLSRSSLESFDIYEKVV